MRAVGGGGGAGGARRPRPPGRGAPATPAYPPPPPNSDILFNAIFLRTLPETVRSALASCAELPSDELAEAAIQLQHTIPPLSAIGIATPLPLLPTLAHIAAAPYDSRRPSRDHRQSPYCCGTPATRCHANAPTAQQSTAPTPPPPTGAAQLFLKDSKTHSKYVPSKYRCSPQSPSFKIISTFFRT